MKILFAVSNENISDAIVKSYQKNYNEAVTYKNVFYFNAIIKEIQRDRTYDRIIISEDLEPFANNNYDAIDKFIFERLDSIAMEINDFSDKRIPIILICTDRRTKPSNMIKKIYNSGIFDAVIGSDRKIDNVCKLINTPRTKEEAAQYYKLDEGTNENKTIEDVSEEEVQNIVSYYKRLGKNEERFTDSFNNIAAQYTDDQLKIIIRYLPINVKAVLETECAKYQELVTYSNPKDAEREKREKAKLMEQKQREKEEQEEQLRIQIEQKKKEEERLKQEQQKSAYVPNNNINVNASQMPTQNNMQETPAAQTPQPMQQKQSINPFASKKQNNQKTNNANLNSLGIDLIDRKMNNPGIQGEVLIPNAINTRKATQVFSNEEMNKESQRTIRPEQIPSAQNEQPKVPQTPQAPQEPQAPIIREEERKEVVENRENTVEQVNNQVNNNVVNNTNSIDDEFESIDTINNVANNNNNNNNNNNVSSIDSSFENSTATLPGFEDLDTNVQPNTVASLESVETTSNVPSEAVEPVKRGRGRPRKTPIDAVPKPKGKRGRPRKNPLPEENTAVLGEEESTDVEVSRPIPAAVESNSTTLPGFENESMSEDFSSFDTFEVPQDKKVEQEVASNVEEKQESSSAVLPGFEEDDEFEAIEQVNNNNVNTQTTTGLDDDFMNFNIKQAPEEKETQNVVEENNNQDTQSNAVLPGMDFDDNLNESQNQVENVQNTNTNTLSGFDELDEVPNNASQNIAPNENINSATTNQTPSTVLPGFEEDGDEFENLNNNINNAASNNLSNNNIQDLNNIEEIPNTEQTLDSSMSQMQDFNTENNELNEEPTTDNTLPGFDETEELSSQTVATATPYRNSDLERQAGIERLEEKRVYSTGTLDSVLTGDKKIVAFVGTSKNGTSFIVNNLAVLFSSLGVKTAILDMTKNKNSYYIYTNNDENLRQIASNSIDKLEEGLAEGIKADRNLDVFTAIPNEEKDFSNAEAILTTLAKNESLVLIDCDFDTPLGYFANASEIYLVQSMDILTIQPLTAFLRELKTNGILDQEKLRVVVNKEIKVRGLTSKVIIGGMSFYNDPSMSYMTELFNKDKIKACTLPFEDSTYSKYLETLVNCNISLSGYSKNFMNSLKILGNMVYPLQSKQTYAKGPDYTKSSTFSDDMNNTLNQMRSKY